MRASSKERDPGGDDEIVQAITDSLKPWAPQKRQIETGERAGEMETKSKTELQVEISEAVRKEIVYLQTTAVPDFYGREAIRNTRNDARDIIKSIDRIEKQLSAKTLSPELRVRLGLHTSLIGSPADIANMPVPRLLDALKDVHDICQAADDNQPITDQVKFWCVGIAFRLVIRFSEDDPTAGSADSPYCAIAGLLYQSVTGKKHQQLRRICQKMLQPYIRDGLLPRRRS